jgi:hypothetical protein
MQIGTNQTLFCKLLVLLIVVGSFVQQKMFAWLHHLLEKETLHT